MILPNKEVLYAIEMRCICTPVRGTLCKIPRRELLLDAMRYFDIMDSDLYVSNPYTELTEDVFVNMNADLFRIFVAYNNKYGPVWSDKELERIDRYSKKYKYVITRHNRRITLRKKFW